MHLWTWCPYLLRLRVSRASALQCRRTIFSQTGVWDEELTTEIKLDIERYWGPRLENHRQKETGKKKFYILSMFPYPSGKLHMGHVRVYAIGDALARFYRMNGNFVIHPMGWDSFGLPAENAAIERGEQPHSWTLKNIAKMKEQLQTLGCSFDWSREFSTCDPQYYKWTQHLFLLMLERGLAYQKEAVVNWDPIDETVLADEQVDEKGCSWRSGAKVEKKVLKQWFLRTTTFSKSLVDGLNDSTLEDWHDVIKIQQFWIGKGDGVSFHFKLKDQSGFLDENLTVWTGQPEAIFGVSFIALSRRHILCRNAKMKVDDGEDCLLDVVAIHPFTNQEIPLYVSDDFTYPEATDAYMGIPGEIEEDALFAKKHFLKSKKVFKLSSDVTASGDQILVNSNEFSELNTEEAREKICSVAKEKGFGGYPTSSTLRDWLISRQRYWGTPIPMVHCPKCKAVPVPLEELPVLLPNIDTDSGRGASALSNMHEWRNVSCPRCGSVAQRETDTMDTFVDSSWYYLRFLDPRNNREPFSTDVINASMPVDIYIGGKEHAYMHLYYARFVNHFYHSLGMTKHKEPFKRLVVQGMVKGLTYRSRASGRYLKLEEIEKQGEKFVERVSGAPVTSSWEKMSKSKFNGVDPEEVIEEYGTDTTRLLMLGDVTPTRDRKWESTNFLGHLNWQRRLWVTVKRFREHRNSEAPLDPLPQQEFEKHELVMRNCRNSSVKGVTFCFQRTCRLNLAIKEMHSFTNNILRMPSAIVRSGLQYERALAALIIMMAPVAPHFASELWVGFSSAAGRFATDIKWDAEFHEQPWPEVDPTDQRPLDVELNGEEAGKADTTRANPIL